MKAEEIIKEREATHGPFFKMACIAQELKEVVRKSESYAFLDNEAAESLDMICTKMGRILSHDDGQNVADNWADISGYAELAREAIGK